MNKNTIRKKRGNHVKNIQAITAMKLIVIFILLLSCSSEQNQRAIVPKKPEPKVEEKTIYDNTEEKAKDKITENDIDTASVTTEKEIKEQVEIDCIFDQKSQTDEFLRGIPQLAGYEWDSAQKLATIVLDTEDTLLVRRGGCNHFGVSAKFILRNDTTDYSKWDNVFERVLWISNLLDSEFYHEKIKQTLDSSQYEIKWGNSVFFLDEYLQDRNYEIFRRLQDDKSIIILSLMKA